MKRKWTDVRNRLEVDSTKCELQILNNDGIKQCADMLEIFLKDKPSLKATASSKKYETQ